MQRFSSVMTYNNTKFRLDSFRRNNEHPTFIYLPRSQGYLERSDEQLLLFRIAIFSPSATCTVIATHQKPLSLCTQAYIHFFGRGNLQSFVQCELQAVGRVRGHYDPSYWMCIGKISFLPTTCEFSLNEEKLLSATSSIRVLGYLFIFHVQSEHWCLISRCRKYAV